MFSPVTARLREFRDELLGFDREPLVVLLAASWLLVISHYRGNTGYFYDAFSSRLQGHPFMPALAHFWWFGSSVVLYALAPLLISKIARLRFSANYGLGLGDWRTGLTVSVVFLAVMLPLVWWASRMTAFKGLYPLAGAGAYTVNDVGAKTSHPSVALFAAYEVAYFAYFVAWEFFFRGWLVHGLEPTLGRAGAVLVQIAPFAVMHFGKAEAETMGSVVAGLALGLLSLRTRSMWYGAVIHGVIAVTMDVLSLPAGVFSGAAAP